MGKIERGGATMSEKDEMFEAFFEILDMYTEEPLKSNLKRLLVTKFDRETSISRMDLNKICPKCNFTYNQHVYTGYEWICPDIEKASGGEKLRAKSVLQSHMSSQSQCGGIENSKPPEPFGMKGDFKREEVHQLILEAVKNGNNILIAEFLDDLRKEKTYQISKELFKKWEAKGQ